MPDELTTKTAEFMRGIMAHYVRKCPVCGIEHVNDGRCEVCAEHCNGEWVGLDLDCSECEFYKIYKDADNA